MNVYYQRTSSSRYSRLFLSVVMVTSGLGGPVGCQRSRTLPNEGPALEKMAHVRDEAMEIAQRETISRPTPTRISEREEGMADIQQHTSSSRLHVPSAGRLGSAPHDRTIADTGVTVQNDPANAVPLGNAPS